MVLSGSNLSRLLDSRDELLSRISCVLPKEVKLRHKNNNVLMILGTGERASASTGGVLQGDGREAEVPGRGGRDHPHDTAGEPAGGRAGV